MGNQRIGTLPDTAPWGKIVGLLADDGSVAEVASATSDAAVKGIDLAKGDRGLATVVLTLIRLVRAARDGDFLDGLDHAGFPMPGDPSFFAVIGAFSESVDRQLLRKGGRTDFSEMAQLAAVESLARSLRRRAENLFAAPDDDVSKAARALSTRDGFAGLAHEFFSSFTQRFLTYHLGRELSQHVGGNNRFANPAEHSAFVERLAVHCREATAIMREFAGSWYSKASHEGEITDKKVQGFVDYALTKIRGELSARGGRGG